MADISGDSHKQNPLTRKLKKILDIRLESDKELVDSLKALSTFFGENSLRTRRNLRGDVERRSLEMCEKFEEQFQEVKQVLDDMSEDVKSMNECCKEMTQRVKDSKGSTAELIEKTSKLRTEGKQLELESMLAASFLERYQLKSEHAKVLRTSKNITEEFFEALKRCKEIHNDCKLLLRSKQQTTGLEIMESMALHQETAYEKLYRWTQGECRAMTGDVPDVSGALCRAVEALQDRQILLGYTFDELTTARRAAVVRCFIDALTRGGPGGTPRPIELYSHDPVRYIGDILAWLHQGVAGEKELLHSLLRRTAISKHKDLIYATLNNIMDGVCRPFKVRIEQVVTSEPGPPVLFRLSNLLKFYAQTVSAMYEAQQSTIASTVAEMSSLSHLMFFNSLALHGNKISEKLELPPPDLSPSQSVVETLQLLKDILSSHDSAIVPVDERRDDYEKIFGSLLEPLLEFCVRAASQLNNIDAATYLLNCLYQVQVTLAVYEFTDSMIEKLSSQTEVYLETLTKEQATFIMGRSGITNLTQDLQSHKSGSPLDNEKITTSLASFDKFLSHPASLNIAQVELIRSTRIRDTIRKQANDLVGSAYTEVYSQIETSGLVKKSPEQVNKLLN